MHLLCAKSPPEVVGKDWSQRASEIFDEIDDDVMKFI